VAVALLAAALVIVMTVGGSLGSGRGGPRYVAGTTTVGGDRYGYLLSMPGDAGRSVRGLVVVLHGCSMTAAQEAAASGFAAAADRFGLAVLFPEVDTADQIHWSCWKGIWDATGERRGSGDAGAIAAMTRAVMRARRIDPARIYAIGISAGAYETVALAADYPDLFAAVGIHSGAAYGGGQLGCLAAGQTTSPTRLLARAALRRMGAHARVMPAIVIHGDRDPIIPYPCGRQALEQWLDTDNLILRQARQDPVPLTPVLVNSTTARGQRFTVASYLRPSGCVIAQMWTVHGMGHAWSGGSTDGSLSRYSDPAGPSAAIAAIRFFAQWRLTPPATGDSTAAACQPNPSLTQEPVHRTR
jgi:poly(hydroxyalkanoate) depolymerase family esterase